MKRVYNFSPGPAMLPEAVLLRAQEELLDWQNSGMSVMEVSHRGTAFIEFAAQSEKRLRGLLQVPDNYKVLFLQGGATLQFAAVPLNIAPPGAVVDYVVTGNWGEKAVQEAQRYVDVNIAATSKAGNFTSIPDPKTWKVSLPSALPDRLSAPASTVSASSLPWRCIASEALRMVRPLTPLPAASSSTSTRVRPHPSTSSVDTATSAAASRDTTTASSSP